MAEISIDTATGLRGVEVENALGRKTTYRAPKKGLPVVDVPAKHAKALLDAGTPGVERYRGKSFNIAAPWLPEKPLNIWRGEE